MEEYKNEKILRELYLDKGLFQREIANKFNVSRRTIGNWLRRFNIPTRNGSEGLVSVKRKTNKEFLEEVSQLKDGNEYLFLEKYKTYHEPIKCKHKICGHIWKVQPARFISSGTRCPKCAKERIHNKLRKSNDEFVKEVKEKSPEYKVLSKYKNYHHKILVKHKKCKTKFKITPDSLLNGYHQCPYCNKRFSGYEIKMSKILNKYNYNFVTQYTFENCKDKNVLPFDFAIFNNDDLLFLLEVDGRQHFEPVLAFGGEKQFKNIKKKDKIREKFCKENNITLIRIDARNWMPYKVI